jgi:hypothetical protein
MLQRAWMSQMERAILSCRSCSSRFVSKQWASLRKDLFPLAQNQFREQTTFKPMKLAPIDVSDGRRQSIFLPTSLTIAASMAGDTAVYTIRLAAAANTRLNYA